MTDTKRRTYLIDRSFQLRATALIVGLTVLISVPLGALLYSTSGQAVAIGRKAVDVGSKANDATAESVKQAELLNKRLEMEAMLKYGDKPELLEQTKRANALETEKLKKQADLVKAEATNFAAQKEELEKLRNTMLAWVIGSILALVVLVGLAGIYFTHKVAGPIYRMRLLFKEVGAGTFSRQRPLREGDELKDFYSDFIQMVAQLKERQRQELLRLDTAIRKIEGSSIDSTSLAELKAARDAIQTSIGSDEKNKSDN